MTAKKLKQSPLTLEDIEQFILDAGSDDLPIFGGKFQGGVYCQQIADEFAPCILAILNAGRPITAYLEIGSAAGGSAFIANHFFSPEKIVLIDDNCHDKSDLRSEVLKGIPYQEIIGNSVDESTTLSLSALGIVFDVVMVDGDHAYENIKTDIETCRRVLRPGGFMIFHDFKINFHFGCARVFEDLKQDKQWQIVGEYVSQKHVRPCGTALFKKAEGSDARAKK